MGRVRSLPQPCRTDSTAGELWENRQTLWDRALWKEQTAGNIYGWPEALSGRADARRSHGPAIARAENARAPLAGEHFDIPTASVLAFAPETALTVQGSKHVLLGDKDLSYGPGQSLLTTMDLPFPCVPTCHPALYAGSASSKSSRTSLVREKRA